MRASAVIRPKVRVRGGDRLKRHLAGQARASRAVDGREVDIGFKGRVAGTAALHEYGGGTIPERPVFRGAARMDGAMTHSLRESVRSVRGVPSRGELREAARAGAEGLRGAYLGARAHVRPVGPTQEARKRGTPGEGRPLVGTEGPKMVNAIRGYVDDDRA